MDEKSHLLPRDGNFALIVGVSLHLKRLAESTIWQAKFLYTSLKGVQFMKTLILYYSYSGNTHKISEMIQSVTGGDLAEIETVQPYPSDYGGVVKQAEGEVKKGF
jgi:hypothetical protein